MSLAVYVHVVVIYVCKGLNYYCGFSGRCYTVSSVADPYPGSGAFLTPGSGMDRKSASGSGIRDEQPESYFLELRNHFFGFFGVKILKFFDADP